MKEYNIAFNTINDQKQLIRFNDTFFNYFSYRTVLPENTLLEVIDWLKNITGKKVAVMFGNCQITILQKFFLKNKIFTDQYILIEIPRVFEYNNPIFVRLFNENLWSVCDLFISQHVKKDNRWSPLVATHTIPSRLPETAKVVWIPNIYFEGYFPQYVRNSHNVGMEIRPSGYFPHGDRFIDAFLDNSGGGGKCTVPELRKYIEDQTFISESEVLSGVEKSFEELRKREWACDIRMLDFIVDNYKRQTFYSPNHPTSNVLLELARRILKFIDISDTTFSDNDWLMSGDNVLNNQDVPIYPKVKEILGMKDCADVFRANRDFKFGDFNLFQANYVDFLVTYAIFCWNDKLLIE